MGQARCFHSENTAGGKRGMTCGEFQGIAARNAIEPVFWGARSTATGWPIRKPFLELSRARALPSPDLVRALNPLSSKERSFDFSARYTSNVQDIVQVFGCRDGGTIHALQWAGVRKAPGHEIAGCGRQQCRGYYGDLATSSGAPVMMRRGSDTRFAAWAERRLKHDRAAVVLSDEILCFLVVVAQQRGVARQAAALSGKSQPRRWYCHVYRGLASAS